MPLGSTAPALRCHYVFTLPAVYCGAAVVFSCLSAAFGFFPAEAFFTAAVISSPFAIALALLAPRQVRSESRWLFMLSLVCGTLGSLWLAFGVLAYALNGGGPIWRLIEYITVEVI